MSNVVDLKGKRTEVKLKLREELLKGIKDFPDEIDSAMVACRTPDGQVHTGFFCTNLVDEAIMLKVLDLDVFRRQWQRDMMDEDAMDE